MPFRFGGDAVHVYLTINTSLAALLDQAIPDLHDDTDIIEVEIIEETA